MRGSTTIPFQDQIIKKTRMNQIKELRIVTGVVLIPFWDRLRYQEVVRKKWRYLLASMSTANLIIATVMTKKILKENKGSILSNFGATE